MGFLSGYTRRKKLITTLSDAVETDYQILLDDLDISNFSFNDARDFRITKCDPANTLLDYWQESCVSGVSADIWVQLHKAGSSVLTSDSGIDNTLFVQDGTVFAIDDYVIICDDNHPDGEVNKITNIATNELTFETAFAVSYMTAQNAKVCHAAYVYYKNASASSVSDGDDTFELFDDFDGVAIDTDKWTEELKGTGTNISVASSECKLDVPDDQICSANIQSVANFTNAIAIHVRRRCPNDIEYIMLSLGSGTICDESGGTSDWWRTTKKSGYWWLIADANIDPTDNEIYKMPASGAKSALTNVDASFSNDDINNYHIHKHIYQLDNPKPLGEGFEKYASNPFSLPGDSTGYGATHPDVLYFPDGEDGYKYWMYYEKGVAGNDCEVYLVRSNDGLVWVEMGITNPILDNITSEEHIPDPDVIKVGSTWYMFLMRGGDGTSQIYRLTSNDGKLWSDPQMIVDRGGVGAWDEDDVVSPTVIYESGTFYLWYVGEDAGYYQVGLATSADGLNFAKDGSNPIFSPEVGEWDDQEIWHIQVTKYDNGYWLYYVGKDLADYRIGLAKSIDRKNFTRSSHNPVLVKVGSGWEANYLYRSSWLQDASGNGVLLDNKMWFYYSAYGGTYYKIGLAKSWENIGDSGTLKWYLDDTLKANVSDADFLNDNKKILITQGAYSATGRGTPSFLDWILVRKYASPEPTSALGSEEEAPPSGSFSSIYAKLIAIGAI